MDIFDFLLSWPVITAFVIILLYTFRSHLPDWNVLFHDNSLKNVPGDKVVLYQVGRGPWAPSISPYPLKLETFLRFAQIPYVNDHSGKLSTKRKTPWMRYQGKVMADSQFCIEHLKKELGIDLNQHLSEEEKAIARAFQKMTEEHLYWAMCAYSFGDDLSSLQELVPFKGILFWMFSRYLRYVVKKQLWGQGMGRHTREETIFVGLGDLKALSTFLGEKKFFMGDEPSEVDCAIFGMICQILYHMNGSPYQKYVKESPNLLGYVERMKNRFWPDWDKSISSSPTYDPSL